MQVVQSKGFRAGMAASPCTKYSARVSRTSGMHARMIHVSAPPPDPYSGSVICDQTYEVPADDRSRRKGVKCADEAGLVEDRGTQVECCVVPRPASRLLRRSKTRCPTLSGFIRLQLERPRSFPQCRLPLPLHSKPRDTGARTIRRSGCVVPQVLVGDCRSTRDGRDTCNIMPL